MTLPKHSRLSVVVLAAALMVSPGCQTDKSAEASPDLTASASKTKTDSADDSDTVAEEASAQTADSPGEDTADTDDMADMITGDWEKWGYNFQGEMAYEESKSFSSDGVWEWHGVEDGEFQEGTWRLEGDKIEYAISAKSKPAARVISDVYVDSNFFTREVYTRVGDGDGLTGTWTRSVEVRKPSSGSSEEVEVITETIQYRDDGTWTLRRTAKGGSEKELPETRGGTYKRIDTDHGTIIVQTQQTKNGVRVGTTSASTFQVVVRDDTLLYSPWERSGDEP